MAPVFLQKASETFRTNPSDIGRIVESLANRLFFTGLLPMVLLMVFGDHIFTFILGGQWVISGRMASYMGIYFLFMILNYPLVSLYRIYKKEHLSLTINFLTLLLAILGLGLGCIYNDFMLGIALFSVASLVGYLVNLYLILNFSGLPSFRIILRWIISFFVVFAVCFSLRMLIEGFLL